MRRLTGKRLHAGVLVFATYIAIAGSASAETGSIVRSILLPGAGQAHSGHYGKATAFATVAVVSAVGLFATQINYNRAVDSFDSNKATYAGYTARLNGGEVISYSEINQTYDDMQAAWDQSEDRLKWRNTFAVALAATYALNLVDILRSRRDTGEIEPAMSVHVENDGGIKIVRTIHF